MAQNFLSQRDKGEINRILAKSLNSIGLSYPENSLDEIANALGITIGEMNFDFVKTAEVYYALKPKGGKHNKGIIAINESLKPERKTYFLAKGIGHCILHKDKDLIIETSEDAARGNDKSDAEAEYFALSLLMPKENFLKMYRVSENEKMVSDYFGVSIPAVRMRLENI